MAPSGRMERLSAMPGKLENWHRVGNNSAGSLRGTVSFVIGLDNGGVVKWGRDF